MIIARSRPGIVATSALLHLARQRSRDAVGIDRRIVEPFGLKENLVAVAFAEPHDLVLDRRTIARPAAADLAGIHRRAMHIFADDPVRRRVRAGDAALDLRVRDASVSAENGSGGSSPGCMSRPAQSMVRPSSRGGVPVLSRPSANPSRSSVRDSPTAGASPTRPAGVCCSPT